jgi:hypothetical protein
MPIDLVKPVLDAIGQGGAGTGASSSAAAPAVTPGAENGALETGDSLALGAGDGDTAADPASSSTSAPSQPDH